MEHLLNIKQKGMKYLLINDNSPNNHQKKQFRKQKRKKQYLCYIQTMKRPPSLISSVICSVKNKLKVYKVFDKAYYLLKF